MKKIIFLFLLIMSFQIYPEGKYSEAAKKATELAKAKIQETQVENSNNNAHRVYCYYVCISIENINIDIGTLKENKKTGSLFEGVDLDKIARESALRANEHFKEEEQKFFKELEAETEKLKVSDR